MADPVAASAVDDMGDDDDFWAAQGDIIDQMVEQHTRERQTQEKGRAREAPAPAYAPSQQLPPFSAAPAATQPAAPPQFSQPSQPPRDYHGGGSQSPFDASTRLAEKEGLISVLRDRLGKAEVNRIQLKRQIDELQRERSGAGGRASSHQSLVQKSAALHLEQQVQQLKQQLAFKDEEIIEARQMRIQREEKMQRIEDEKAALAASLKKLEANQATAEAERLLSMQGGVGLGLENGNHGHGGAASPTKAKRASLAGSTFDAGGYNTNNNHDHSMHPPLHHHHHHHHQGMREVSGVDGGGGGADPREAREALKRRARDGLVASASDLTAAITSRMRSKDPLEAQVAQALCLSLATRGDLESVTLLLLRFVLGYAEQAARHPGSGQLSEEIYKAGRGATCLDSALRLLHRIFYVDFECRRQAALLLLGDGPQAASPGGMDVDGDASSAKTKAQKHPKSQQQQQQPLLRRFVSLVGHCASNAETGAKVVEILTMVVASVPCEGREAFAWLLGLLLNDDKAAAGSAAGSGVSSSGSGHGGDNSGGGKSARELCKGALFYPLLECRAIAGSVLKAENVQAALFRFLEKGIDFGVQSTFPPPSSEATGSSGGGEGQGEGEGEGEEALRRGLRESLAVSRQGFSLCALLHRQAAECLAFDPERGGEGRRVPLTAAVLAKFGKVAAAVVKFLGALLDHLEAQSRRGRLSAHLCDDLLAAVLEGLSLLQILLCEGDAGGVELTWKAALRDSALLRQFHITMTLLLQGSLQLVERRWCDMRPAVLRTPALWTLGERLTVGEEDDDDPAGAWPGPGRGRGQRGGASTPVDAITELAETIYKEYRLIHESATPQ